MSSKNENIKDVQIAKTLYKDIAALIEQSRSYVALTINREITVLNYNIGKTISNCLLKNKRAGYGETVIANLSEQLKVSFGKGWGIRHLWHCVRVADTFPEDQIVNALSTQLSWTHLRELAAIPEDLKRTFYTELCVKERWSTRTLADRIGSLLYERTALSKKPEKLIKQELDILKSKGTVTSDLVFRDPYILNFLGLPELYTENDFESAILNQLQQFITELGSDFAFIARQKRIIIDNDDHKIDLLFFHRGLRRLIAIDLKLDRFKAAYKGQMELYLKWLDKYERKADEETPVGLILCSQKQQEQIELLELNKGQIRVSEYLTQLPSKELLAEKLHRAIEIAREREKKK
jgi:predicted nuclease of restriction endonuclease-like (RecB) superfamily